MAGMAQAQDITNAVQLALTFDQPGIAYPLAFPYEPIRFQPMETLFVDFSTVTNALAAITNYAGEVQNGVNVWRMRLIQNAETGEVVVKAATNDVELLQLAAPSSFVPYATYNETLRMWAIFFGDGYTSYSDLIAYDGYTFLDPPRVVIDAWVISSADEDSYYSDGSSFSWGGSTMMSGGESPMFLDGDPCSITNDSQPFSIVDIYQDANLYTTVSFESCTNWLYGVLSTDELSTNTTWQTRAYMWGLASTSSWTDVTTTNIDQRFYKVVRMPAPNEWYGPFASWTNVMDFGATGNGVTDDTVAVSNALASVGLGNCSPVLYFPSGHTYRVTQKLWLRNRQYVEIVGQDRDTTIIKYDGPMGTLNGYLGPATVFHADGLVESHIARLTFDGNNKANTILGHSVSPGGNFDEGNSIVDCVFKNSVNIENINEGHGVDGGYYGAGFANVDFTRCIFTNTSVGLWTWDQNALDAWLTDCYLVDNIFGVFLLQGSAHAYHSTFSNSEADFILYKQAINFISLVGNTSYRSGVFFQENPASGNQTPTLIKGNTVIDPSPDAIEIDQSGPIFMIDNVIAFTNGPAVDFLLNSPQEFMAIGNTNTTPNWFTNVVNTVLSTNLVDNYVVARSNLTFTMPPPPSPATNLNRIVVEMGTNFASSDLQTAVNNAADGTVIHIPWVSNIFGSIPITQTITMPTNKDIRIIGDGYHTKLAWSGSAGGTMFSLPHPSHITFAHIQLSGNGSSGPLIAVSGVDSTPARVYARDTRMSQGITANIRLGDCPNAVIDYRGIVSDATSTPPAHGANAILDGRGKVRMIDVDSDNNTIGFICTNGGSLYVETSYNEASTNNFTNKTFRVSGNSTVTFLSGVQHENTRTNGVTDFSRATSNGFAVVNFSGNLMMGLVNGVIDWYNISGTSTGSVWITGDTTIDCPVNHWPIINSTTNIPVQTMNWNYNGGASTNNDIGSASAAFTRRMLTQARAEYSDLAPMARRADQTDVLLENVLLNLGGVNLSVQP